MTWTTTKSASTTPGTGTSPCPCSPPRSSPSPPTPNEHEIKKGHNTRPPRTDPPVPQRNPTTLGHPDPLETPRTTHQPLVTMATTPPNPSPPKPLPATTTQVQHAAAVVLTRKLAHFNATPCPTQLPVPPRSPQPQAKSPKHAIVPVQPRDRVVTQARPLPPVTSESWSPTRPRRRSRRPRRR
jgi:hypothetical protein